MYVRKQDPEGIETPELRAEYRKLRREAHERNRKGHTLGRFRNLATRIARRLHAVRAELKARDAFERAA